MAQVPRKRARRIPLELVLASALVVALAPLARAQSKRVSRPMLATEPALSVTRFVGAPAHGRVFFSLQGGELFSTGIEGEPLRHLGTGAGSLRVQPQSERCVWYDTASDATAYSAHVYSGRVASSGATLRLDSLYRLSSSAVRLALSPDGAWAAWYVDGWTGIRVLPTDGTAFALPVPYLASPILELAFTADSSRIVYRSAQQLFIVPVDASVPPVRLDGTSSVSDVLSFQLGPERVVYHSDEQVRGRYELFARDLDGQGPLIKLSATPVSGGDVAEYRLSPDERFVVYRADALVNETYELFQVPLRGGSPPVRLSESNPALTAVQPDFAISADSRTVVFRAAAGAGARIELHGVDAQGISRPRVLNAPLVPGSNVLDFLLSPQGDQVAYRADGEEPGRIELYSVPIKEGSTAVRLSDSLLPEADVQPDYRFDPLAEFVFYRQDRSQDETFELLARATSGAGDTRVLNGPLVAGGDVEPGFDASFGSGRVVYLADESSDGFKELWSVTLDGARHNLGPGPGTRGDVTAYAFAEGADGRTRAVYLADREQDGVFELHAASLDGPAEHVELSPPLPASADVLSLATTPDGRWTVFTANHVQGLPHLFAVPSDASSPAHRLSSDILDLPGFGVRAFALTADGTRVLYSADTVLYHELYSVPVDGSALPVRLNSDLPSPGFAMVSHFEAFRGGVVYFVESRATSPWTYELWTAPDDGSGPARLLVPGFPSDGLHDPMKVSPDGAFTLYVADSLVRGQYELFKVPNDGSAPPVRLSHPLGPSGDVTGFPTNFAFTPDSSRVVYRADATTDNVFELFSVPLDGSSQPVQISSGAWNFDVSPDSTRVVFRGDRFNGLFSVPVGGGSPPVLLHEPFQFPWQAVHLHVIEHDSRHVLFTATLIDPPQPEFADDFDPGRMDLYRVPIDGSAPPILIGPANPSVQALGVESIELSPDGRWAAFSGTLRSMKKEVFVVELETLALKHFPEARLPGFSPNSRRLMFLSRTSSFTLSDPLVEELFQHALEHSLWRKR